MEVRPGNNTPPPDGEKWFRIRHLTTTLFALGILLFFLPFAEIRCNDALIASNTGIGMATGQAWKTHGFLKDTDKDKNEKQDKKTGARFSGGLHDWPNILTLVAILAAVGGLIFNIRGSNLRAVISLSTGLLAAVMLVAMMIQLKADLRSPDQSANDSVSVIGRETIHLSVYYTPWLYLAIVLFVIAAISGYKQHKQEEREAIGKAVDFDFQRMGKTEEEAPPGNNT